MLLTLALQLRRHAGIPAIVRDEESGDDLHSTEEASGGCLRDFSAFVCMLLAFFTLTHYNLERSGRHDMQSGCSHIKEAKCRHFSPDTAWAHGIRAATDSPPVTHHAIQL